MPEDSDANIVKIVISEDGYIPLLVRQSMAEITAGLGIEQFPTAFGRVADRVCIASDEMVEGRVERNQSAFVGCNGAQHILFVHAPTESLHKFGLIVLIVSDLGHSIANTGRAHLEGIRDRQCRLLLKCIDPTVPKLSLVIEGVQNRWSVALTDAALDAD